MIILRQHSFSKKTELSKLGRETDQEIREAVKGTKAEKKVGSILKRSAKEMKEAAQKEYTTHDKLYKKWQETNDPEIAYKWSQAWGNEVYDKTKDKSTLKPDPKAMKAATDYVKSKDPEGYTEMTKHNKAIEKAWKSGDKKAQEKAKEESIKWAKKHNATQKSYSKQDREVVPADIVKKVKDGGGVIQKDHNGDWRIISMKTKTNKSGRPEFWSGHYSSKEDASKALSSYFVNKKK